METSLIEVNARIEALTQLRNEAQDRSVLLFGKLALAEFERDTLKAEVERLTPPQKPADG